MTRASYHLLALSLGLGFAGATACTGGGTMDGGDVTDAAETGMQTCPAPDRTTPLHAPTVCSDDTVGPFRQMDGTIVCEPVGADARLATTDWPDTTGAAAPVVYVAPSVSAVGNGSMTAPYASIEQALAASTPPRTIVLARGTFALGAPARFSRDVTFLGAGPSLGSTIRVRRDLPGFAIVGAHLTVRGVTVAYDEAVRGTSREVAFDASAGATLTLQQVTVDDAFRAIALDASHWDGDGITVRRARGTGITLTSASTMDIANLAVRDGASEGIRATGSNVKLRHSLLSENALGGLFLDGGSATHTADQVSMQCDSFVGMQARGALEFTGHLLDVSGTRRSRSDSGIGLQLLGGAHATLDSAIASDAESGHGSGFVGNEGAGIVVDGAGSQLTIHGAMVGSNGGVGLYVAQGAVATDVSYSVLDDNVGAALAVAPGGAIAGMQCDAFSASRATRSLTANALAGDGLSVDHAAQPLSGHGNHFDCNARYGALFVESGGQLAGSTGYGNQFGVGSYGATQATIDVPAAIRGSQSAPQTADATTTRQPAGTCVSATETCNGLDEDCDGAIDNGFECAAGRIEPCVTMCGSTGTRTCSNACSFGTCTPPVEVCNGIDDDCDGQVDSAGCAITAIAAGERHVCALYGSGRVACWGGNDAAQLGNGDYFDRSSATPVTGLTDATALAAGGTSTCVLRTGGVVSCWGGDPSLTTPRDVANLTNPVEIAVGRQKACARLADGTMACWLVGNLNAFPIPGLANVAQIAVGGGHECARLTDGTIQCFGSNDNAQLGDGTMVDRATPAPVTGIADATMVRAGYLSTCAVRATGDLVCWGYNYFGNLGNGMGMGAPQQTTPSTALEITNPTDIAIGQAHTCAIRRDTSVGCYGWDAFGAVGDAAPMAPSIVWSPRGLTGVLQVVAGDYFTCARTATDVVCWGENDRTQLGDGTGVDHHLPHTILGVNRAVQVNAVGHHVAVRLADGSVMQWGSNEVGDAPTTVLHNTTTPTVVTGITDAVEIAGAGDHNGDDDHECARRRDGSVVCWGTNRFSVLGSGMMIMRSPVPVPVLGLSNVAQLTAGGFFTCARTTSGAVSCWGDDSSGQIGDGTYNEAMTPTAVSGLADAIDLVGGFDHACARRMNGSVVCWGSNSTHALGTSTAINSNVPVDAASTAVGVSAGKGTTCLRNGDGTVSCLSETTGQPVVVPGVTNAVQIVAGWYHGCARRTDGTIACWGTNDAGQLGDGTSQNQLTAVQVPGISDAVDVSAGSRHTCAVRANGNVLCWGDNDRSQQGVPTVRATWAPVVGVR